MLGKSHPPSRIPLFPGEESLALTSTVQSHPSARETSDSVGRRDSSPKASLPCKALQSSTKATRCSTSVQLLRWPAKRTAAPARYTQLVATAGLLSAKLWAFTGTWMNQTGLCYGKCFLCLEQEQSRHQSSHLRSKKANLYEDERLVMKFFNQDKAVLLLASATTSILTCLQLAKHKALSTDLSFTSLFSSCTSHSQNKSFNTVIRAALSPNPS